MYVLHKIEAAQAFDELSILEIKIKKSEDSKQIESLKKQLYILWEELNQSLGVDLAKKIYHSYYYTNLYDANFKIFKSVEKFKNTEPAQLNMERIDAKRNLQKKFFNQFLEEVKI